MSQIEAVLIHEAHRASKRKNLKDIGVDPETANLRALGYKARIGADYQCPWCFIKDGERTPLDPIPTGTRDDAFGCDRCGSDYLIER